MAERGAEGLREMKLRWRERFDGSGGERGEVRCFEVSDRFHHEGEWDLRRGVRWEGRGSEERLTQQLTAQGTPRKAMTTMAPCTDSTQNVPKMHTAYIANPAVQKFLGVSTDSARRVQRPSGDVWERLTIMG